MLTSGDYQSDKIRIIWHKFLLDLLKTALKGSMAYLAQSVSKNKIFYSKNIIKLTYQQKNACSKIMYAKSLYVFKKKNYKYSQDIIQQIT